MESMVPAYHPAQDRASANPRVAFFGGSFDPPHYGHLAVARAARDALRLDRVLFAPVGAQPLKPHGSTADFRDRVAMTDLAIAGDPGFTLSMIDAPGPAGQPNYTLHTLQHLQAEAPDAHLFCLMGADSFLSLRRWHRAAEIPFTATLVVASRPGENIADVAASLPEGLTAEPTKNPHQSADPTVQLVCYALRDPQRNVASLYILPGLDVEISATDIRRQIRSAGAFDPSRPLIPPAVAQYIRDHNVYQ